MESFRWDLREVTLLSTGDLSIAPESKIRARDERRTAVVGYRSRGVKALIDKVALENFRD